MNEPQEFWDLDHRLDRLVDGELGGDEYRELLALLEENEDGWRRCAMAFLEAQVWSQELGIVRESVESSVETRPPAGKIKMARSLAFLVAIAASFLLAFGLFGLASQFQGWSGNADSGVNIVRKPVNGPVPDGGSVAGGVSTIDGFAAGEPDLASETPLDGQPLGLATFVMANGDGSAKEIDVPVFDVNDAQGKRMLEDSTNVPPNIRRALQRLGYEVHRDVHWSPVELEEGGQIMVPYGQVEIKPVSDRSFH